MVVFLGYWGGYELILIVVQWLILMVLMVPIMAVGLEFLVSNLKMGLDVAMWDFAFGFLLSCVLGCEGCNGCVVIVAVVGDCCLGCVLY